MLTRSSHSEIRDVPDEVHDALHAGAEARGLSLTRRAEIAQENAAVVRRTQAAIGDGADRDVILAAIRDGRGE